MDSVLKQQIEQGSNTENMMAFAIPEVGPIAGALLTGGGAAFGALFYFPTHVDPLDRIPTERDIVQLNSDLLLAINQGFDTHDLDVASDYFERRVKTLRGAWDDTNTDQGLTFLGKFRDTAAETQWLEDQTNAIQGPLKYDVNGNTPQM